MSLGDDPSYAGLTGSTAGTANAQDILAWHLTDT
jgi:hypothetical protein